MNNLLGIDFGHDLHEAQNDFGEQIHFGAEFVGCSSSMLTYVVETVDGGTKEVPGISLSCVLADFTTVPRAGDKLIKGEVTLRVMTVERLSDNETVRLRCSYVDD